MQDLAAILIAGAAVAWLVRRAIRRFRRPGCTTCAGSPAGRADGFVPLATLRQNAQRTREEPNACSPQDR